MNEKVDLTKILKNCPKGFKLYSPMVGEVEFERILDGRAYPIITSYNERTLAFTNKGFYYDDAGAEAECLLFPSAEQRDWTKFKSPWHKQDKDDERLRKTTIAFLKDFAEQGYENAVECIDWLEKQDEDKKEINNFDVLPGLYKCIHRMFDGTPDGRLLFEIDNVYKCLSKHDRAEFEVSYGHSVYLEDPIVRKYFIPFEGEQIPSPKFKVGDKIVNSFRKYMRDLSSQGIISKITNDKYIFTDGSYIFISEQDSWDLVSDKFDQKTLQPFDRVLVKDGYSQCWRCNLFSHTETEYPMFPYTTHVGHFYYCIPYNDETKHLLGTNEEAPKYYRYWED